jgi:hypothetical protein
VWRSGAHARTRAIGAHAGTNGVGLDDEVGRAAAFDGAFWFLRDATRVPAFGTPMMLYTALSSLLELHRDAFGLTREQPMRQT